MKYWEIIADRLHAEGWSYGIAEHLTKHGFLFCVDAHREGKRFIVKADDLLTAFFRWRETRQCQKGANGNETRQSVAKGYTRIAMRGSGPFPVKHGIVFTRCVTQILSGVTTGFYLRTQLLS